MIELQDIDFSYAAGGFHLRIEELRTVLQRGRAFTPPRASD